MKKRNLLALADHLESLPTDYDRFDMRYFHLTDKGAGHNRGRPLEASRAPECGTVACAMGHAPSISKRFAGRPEEGWADYGTRMFNIIPHEAWNWCFSGVWSEHEGQDTPAAAAARIRVLVETGKPGEWPNPWYK